MEFNDDMPFDLDNLPPFASDQNKHLNLQVKFNWRSELPTFPSDLRDNLIHSPDQFELSIIPFPCYDRHSLLLDQATRRGLEQINQRTAREQWKNRVDERTSEKCTQRVSQHAKYLVFQNQRAIHRRSPPTDIR